MRASHLVKICIVFVTFILTSCRSFRVPAGCQIKREAIIRWWNSGFGGVNIRWYLKFMEMTLRCLLNHHTWNNISGIWFRFKVFHTIIIVWNLVVHIWNYGNIPIGFRWTRSWHSRITHKKGLSCILIIAWVHPGVRMDSNPKILNKPTL